MAEIAPTRAPARPPRPPASVRRDARRPATTTAVAGIPPAVGRLPLGAGAGQPISGEVRQRIEASLGADTSGIRVYADTAAAGTARALGARAFTVGRGIFLGPGERASDVALMAHEVAHVLQQGGAAALQSAGARSAGAAEHEARQAATATVQGASFAVTETADAGVQRLGISDALNYFAGKANLIPGFRMFTVVLGVNPINMSRVDRSAANVLRAVVELIPGGALITTALDRYGVFDRVGTWVEGRIRTLGMVGATIREAIDKFLDSLGWRDIFDLGDVWERAKRIFTEPITRLIDFGKGLVDGIIGFVKDAILRPLAGLAQQTRGWDLLRAVLGSDPITGDAYPRTAETLIGGFMKLIGQTEVWENLKKANAVPRAWAWFQRTLDVLLGFVRQLPATFVSALRSLELTDIVVLPRAFAKVIGALGSFAARFVSWGAERVLRLLEIIFEVMAPGAMVYLRKAMGAFKTIVSNPVGFIRNLVRAGIQGFQQFGTNFLAHLRTSLIQWLTGSLGGAGIYIPQAFELREIIKFVLSVLGLTWANVRVKLVKAIGETAVKVLEEGFQIVTTLVTEGPAAAWEKIKEQLSNLREMVIGQVMDFVKERVVQAAITKLLTSLNPAGAFIQAVLAIYNTVMFVVERLKQIGQVVASFIDSISSIAAGAVGAAANRVEQTMAGLLTLVISFLARIAGLGRVSDAVLAVVNKIRAPIDKALDKVIEWIVTAAKKVGKMAVQAGVPQDPNERIRLGLRAAVAATIALSGDLTAGMINTALAVIKVRYGLKALTAQAKDGTWWIEGEINPIARVDSKRPLKEITAKLAHKQVIERLSEDRASLLRGNGNWIPGFAGRDFGPNEFDPLDDIGYVSFDHSDSNIKSPGTKPNPRNKWGKRGKGSWIPDHQPPDIVIDGGAQRVKFRFYPHSLISARRQGGVVRTYKAWMKELRKRGDKNWAEGIKSEWFH